MRPHLNRYICAGCFFLLAFLITGRSKETKSPQEILSKALQERDSAATMRTVEIQQKGAIHLQLVTYKKLAPSGLRLERVEISRIDAEIPPDKRDTQVALQNERGYWKIDANNAILMNFIAKDEATEMVEKPSASIVNVSNTFQATSISHNERPCTRITMTVSDPIYQRNLHDRQVLIDKRSSSTAPAINGLLKQLGSQRTPPRINAADVEPYSCQYVVDNANNVIWTEMLYAKSGALIKAHFYTVIDYSTIWPDDIFEPPPNAKVLNASSLEDYLKIRMNEVITK